MTALTRIIMEMGYNLRGAKEKIRELNYGGWIKEKDLLFFDAEELSHKHKREEGKGMVAKGSEQEDE